jgi:hypothetical protein
MIEVPDHIYVLSDIYTCHTYCCYAYYIFKCIGCTLLTCDMYMCRLRHIHDPALLSLKMEGTRLLFFNGIDACISHTCNMARLTRYCNNMRLNG